MVKKIAFACILLTLPTLPVLAGDLNSFTARGHVQTVFDTTPPRIVIYDYAHGVEQSFILICGGGTDCLAKHDVDPGPGVEEKPVLLGACPYVYTSLSDGPSFWACTVDGNNEDTFGECVNAGGWLRDDGVNPMYGSLWGVTIGTDCAPK